MAAVRHYQYVPTVTLTKEGRRVGRRPKPEHEQKRRRITVALTDEQYTAFERWMRIHSFQLDATAATKAVLDRLKTDGFLTPDGQLPPEPSTD